MESGAFFREWVWATLVVHLQLALLVDHDVILKRKVHWLGTLVDPSRNVNAWFVCTFSGIPVGDNLPSENFWFTVTFINVLVVPILLCGICIFFACILCTCSGIPQDSGRSPASLCGSLSWASLTYIFIFMSSCFLEIHNIWHSLISSVLLYWLTNTNLK